jgi:hypothetical protein
MSNVGFLCVGLEDKPLAGAPAAGVHQRVEALGEFVLVVMRVAVGAQVEVALRLPRCAPFVTTCVSRMEGCSAALALSPPADDLLQMLHSDLWSAMMHANPNNVGVNGRS